MGKGDMTPATTRKALVFIRPWLKCHKRGRYLGCGRLNADREAGRSLEQQARQVLAQVFEIPFELDAALMIDQMQPDGATRPSAPTRCAAIMS
jgi:hypothetical protein